MVRLLSRSDMVSILSMQDVIHGVAAVDDVFHDEHVATGNLLAKVAMGSMRVALRAGR